MSLRLASAVLVLALLAAACASSTDEFGEEAPPTATPTATPEPTAATPDPTPTPEATEATPDPTPTEPTVGPACSPLRPSAGGLQELTFTHDGADRQVRLTMPATEGDEPLPVVFALHGFTSSAETMASRSRYEDLATARGYAVVIPDGTESNPDDPESFLLWSLAAEDNPDVDVIVALLDHVGEFACIDSQRLYLSGLSNGAGLSVLALCHHPELFAMAGVVAGVNLSRCLGGGRGVVAVHGDQDQAIVYGGGGDVPSVPAAMAELARNGGCSDEPELEMAAADVEVLTWVDCADDAKFLLYTVLGGGHVWPENASEVILDAFDRHGVRLESASPDDPD